MSTITFRPYDTSDAHLCLDIFDENCPEFLAPDERQDYEAFLEHPSKGYEVCELEGQIVGVYGLCGDSKDEKRLNWIMVGTKSQGLGVGNEIMERVIRLGRNSKTKLIGLETSQKVAPFFKQYGAVTISSTKNGFGAGIDRVDMIIPL